MKRKIMLLVICSMIACGNTSKVSADYPLSRAQMMVDDSHQIVPHYVNVANIRGCANAVNGKIKVSVAVSNRKADKIKIQMYLQKKCNGGWTTIKTWAKSYTNSKRVSATEIYRGSKGSIYRMKYKVTIRGDAKSGTTSEVKA